MSIKICDCSLRDGGYIGQKNFPVHFIRILLDGLMQAGIDYIETGFLQSVNNNETLVYSNSSEVKKYLPEGFRKTSYVGFCDNSRYSIDLLDRASEDSFTVCKLSFAKYEISEAVSFAKGIKEKGYQLFFQPMDAMGYTEIEWRELLNLVNELNPTAFAIVDTFGVMHLDDLEKIFKLTHSILNVGITISLHTHNNLLIGNALAEMLAILGRDNNRNIILDASLLGMARGAGNACTEVIADFLNKKFDAKYNIEKIIQLIDEYILPLERDSTWGYSLPMFICGTENSHVDNYKYMKERGISNIDMYNILNSMNREDKIRYRKGYIKDDFSVLDNQINKYYK